ncbi:MAG: cytochrome c [Deltaproteobacteria bacterium]|nr:cytochrome c [Deltaproteobacteria bacterium]
MCRPNPRLSGRKAWLYAGLALLGLALGSGEAAAQVFSPLGDPLKGQRLFETKRCIRCHRVAGTGGTVGPDLSRVGQERHLSDIAGLLWNHSLPMTAKMRELGISRPTFSGSEMADLLAYLYTLNYFDRPGDPARGERLFQEKQCAACHGVGGKSTAIGPPVEKLGAFGSPLLMIQAMWNHGPDMQDRMKALGIPRLVLHETDMADLLAYFRRKGRQDGRVSGSLVPGDPKEGWKLFTIKGCIRCHAVQGQGGKVGPDLSRRRLPETPSGLAALLWNHGARMHEQMPRLGVPPPSFKGTEVSDMVAYLYFIGFFDPPASPARGRAVFTNKGCVRCHAINGKGGRVGPDLARSQAVLSLVEAARLMWNHAPFMEERMKKLGISWPLFVRSEMADLLAYLTSLPVSGAGRR